MEETKINAQPIDSKIPEGPIAEKWTNYKAHQKLVNPANKSLRNGPTIRLTRNSSTPPTSVNSTSSSWVPVWLALRQPPHWARWDLTY